MVAAAVQKHPPQKYSHTAKARVEMVAAYAKEAHSAIEKLATSMSVFFFYMLEEKVPTHMAHLAQVKSLFNVLKTHVF